MGRHRILFPILLLLFICCSSSVIIVDGDLISSIDGKRSKLTEAQLSRLNAMMNSGPDRIPEQKWQVGNHVVAKDNEGKKYNIYSYADRYYCIDNSNLCYAVDQQHMNDFGIVFNAQELK